MGSRITKNGFCCSKYVYAYITNTAGNRRGCLRETRKDVLWEIERDRRVFWLNGLAGTGTSTIATLQTGDDLPDTCLSVSTFPRGAAPGLMFADGEARCWFAQSYPHSDPHRQRRFESPRVPRPVGLPPEDRRSPIPVLIPLRGKLSHHRVAPAIKSSSRLDNRLRACHAPFVFESQAEWDDRPGNVCHGMGRTFPLTELTTRVPPRRSRILLLPFYPVYPPQTIRSPPPLRPGHIPT